MIGTKKQETKFNKNAAADPNAFNTIAYGTFVNGNIKSEGDMKINGKLEGNIVATGKVLIGKTGIVIGNVECTRSDISGTVEGKLIIKEILSLKASAKVVGDIITPKMSIEPGASFDGTCKMSNKGEIISAPKIDIKKKP